MQILQQHPERYDLHYKVGVIFLLTGKLDAAQKELALVLVHQPEMLKAHEAMGLVHLQNKNYPLAINEFQFVLARDPQRAKTTTSWDSPSWRSGWPDQAILAARTAISVDPHQLSSHIALGQAYQQLKGYPHAVATLKQAQTLAPRTQRSTKCWDRRWRPRSSIPRLWMPL